MFLLQHQGKSLLTICLHSSIKFRICFLKVRTLFITSKGKIIKPFPQWRGLTLFHSDNPRHNTHPGLTKLDCTLPDKNILTIVRAPILSSSNINFLIKLKLRLQHVVRRKIFSLICSFFLPLSIIKSSSFLALG